MVTLQASSESPGHKIPPVGDSFAWKDNTLDKDLRMQETTPQPKLSSTKRGNQS